MSHLWESEAVVAALWHRLTGRTRLGLQRVLLVVGASLMVLSDVILPLAGVQRVAAYWHPSLVTLPVILGFCVWLGAAPLQVYGLVPHVVVPVAGMVTVAGFWLVPVDILYDALVTGHLEHTYLGLLGFSMIGLAYLTGLRYFVEAVRRQT